MRRDLLESALILRNDSRFKSFVNFMREEQELALRTLTNSFDDRAMYAAQGAYRVVQKILDLIERSPELLDKGAR